MNGYISYHFPKKVFRISFQGWITVISASKGQMVKGAAGEVKDITSRVLRRGADQWSHRRLVI